MKKAFFTCMMICCVLLVGCANSMQTVSIKPTPRTDQENPGEYIEPSKKADALLQSQDYVSIYTDEKVEYDPTYSLKPADLAPQTSFFISEDVYISLGMHINDIYQISYRFDYSCVENSYDRESSAEMLKYLEVEGLSCVFDTNGYLIWLANYGGYTEHHLTAGFIQYGDTLKKVIEIYGTKCIVDYINARDVEMLVCSYELDCGYMQVYFEMEDADPYTSRVTSIAFSDYMHKREINEVREVLRNEKVVYITNDHQLIFENKEKSFWVNSSFSEDDLFFDPLIEERNIQTEEVYSWMSAGEPLVEIFVTEEGQISQINCWDAGARTARGVIVGVSQYGDVCSKYGTNYESVCMDGQMELKYDMSYVNLFFALDEKGIVKSVRIKAKA